MRNRNRYRLILPAAVISLLVAGWWLFFDTSSIGLTGKRSPGAPPDMVLIPAGEFIMGTDISTAPPVPASYGLQHPYRDESPQRRATIKAFYIDRYEVTVAKYQKFLDATGYPPPYYWDNLDRLAFAQYPVVNIRWQDAQAYANWAGKRLPTEAEWEKAARGTDGRQFPWGDTFDERKGNFSQEGLSPVGTFPEDVSPYGVYDMGGNAAEWTADWYRPYPGGTFAQDSLDDGFRVVRGGAWGGGTGHYNLSYFARSAYRGLLEPEERLAEIGFRCAKSP